MLKFPRKKTPAELLSAAKWVCRECKVQHEGLFDLSSPAPDYWCLPIDPQPNGALQMDGDFLSEDFCVIDGTNFFVRCVFPIPVPEVGSDFGFGVWSTLSRSNFEKYVKAFDEPPDETLGPWTGYFSNRLAGFPETVPESCWVLPRSDRLRPTLKLMNEDHPLARAQSEGVSAQRILEIYTSYGHAPK